ncbi:MAG: acyl-CoA dehydrogenase [Actinomyces sp.]|nr:MAG: acyl-CoA dehydrogenase [Actinomyces sp.]
MHAAFTETQEMFRAAVRDLLADRRPPAAVRAAREDGTGRVPGLWEALAEMGVLGALVPEELGGLGADEIDVVGVLEEAGYAACGEPLAEHAVVALPAVAAAVTSGDVAELADLVTGAVAGRVTLTARVPPAGRFVAHATVADHLVLDVDGVLVLVAAEEAAPVPEPSLDPGRHLGAVAVDPGAGVALRGADPSRAAERGVLAAAAQAVGVARRLLDDTVAYVSERRQFGKPVGSYQAVKHHLADVRLGIEFAAPLVYRAAWSVAHRDPEAGRDVSAAKAAASDAVDLACRMALQCHGAIGYTAEYDLHLWLERGWTLAADWGDARWHRRRVAAHLGL